MGETSASEPRAGIGQLGLGQPGDLPGDLEHDLLGLVGTRPHGLSDLVGATAGRAPAIPDPGAGRTPSGLDAFGRAGQLVDRAGQQSQVWENNAWAGSRTFTM